MLKVEAIVPTSQREPVKDALNEIGVQGMTLSNVYGCGQQRGQINGEMADLDLKLLDQVKFEIAVSSREWADKVIESIMKSARTGNFGDGKIFVYDLDNVYRVRTGETGYDALN